jgi:hypothetical protein
LLDSTAYEENVCIAPNVTAGAVHITQIDDLKFLFSYCYVLSLTCVLGDTRLTFSDMRLFPALALFTVTYTYLLFVALHNTSCMGRRDRPEYR